MSGPGAKNGPPPRVSARARLRPKAQITLPEEIRRALHVSEGDEIEFAVQHDGTITVRGYVSVPSDQAWFFTRQGLVGNQQADHEIAVGGGKVHVSTSAMFAHLGVLGAADADGDV
jgi:antitoxin PrlF